MRATIIVLLLIFAGYLFISRGEVEKKEAPLLPENCDQRNIPETFSAVSYYASAMKWNRYDLLVAAANLQQDNWPEYVDTAAKFLGQRDKLIGQCANAFGENLKSNPYRAVNEDIHAMLGLARQFGYLRLASDAALTGIELEMNILGWFVRLSPELPAEASSCFSRILKEHWAICEREGSISKTMPDYLKGDILSEPVWRRAAVMEENYLNCAVMCKDLSKLSIKPILRTPGTWRRIPQLLERMR